MTKRTTIRGKESVFTSKTLANGETAYYRDGKRAKTDYQIRLARGVLSGLTPREATGKDKITFGEHEEKRLTEVEIAREEEFHLGSWAASPRNDKEGKRKHDYYIKVSVTSESFRRVGSEPKNEDACVPATLKLLDPRKNTQSGMTYIEATRNFSEKVLFTVDRSGLALCSGDLAADLLGIWRHTTR